MGKHDAIVVGSGPNGLTAAVVLAQAGLKVLVREAQPTFGGGTRTAELTLPGFKHDLCSAVHPLGIASPFLRTLPLEKHGLEWIQPDLPLAHPLDGGEAAWASNDIEETARALGRDGKGWRKLYDPFVRSFDDLVADALAPLGLPKHPLLLARFGLCAMRSVDGIARSYFRDAHARALFAGIGAHSLLPLDQSPSAAVAMMLGAALHVRGWPIPRGGSQMLANALVELLGSLGGEIELSSPVKSYSDLEPARTVLFDLTPRQLLPILGDKLSPSFRGYFENFRYGPGIFKVDWALSQPIPWANKNVGRAGTVHVGGTLEEISASEAAPWLGKHCDRPYVLLSQPSAFDPTRAPAGKHVGWAYCHVPQGSTRDMTEIIENQVERFAPGFKDTILARATANTAQLEARNANLVGGDISGGVPDLRQLFLRPSPRPNPYALPLPRHYICSASTPPGPGVHGMCGYFAAKAALKTLDL